MTDPDALPGRRAWVHCARCVDGRDCPTCRAGRTCERHWRYLLAAEGKSLWVQCPACRHRWWNDTGFSAHPRVPRAVPAWPHRAA